jgi:heavy metal sensor kinase
MRRLSIKARVTLWYTGLLLLLLVAGTVYLLSFSGQITNRQLRDALQESVSEAVKNARFDHGELEDEDIDFYKNGVSVFLYDTSGRLLAPRVNRGIQVNAVLEDQQVKTVEGAGGRWMVYDIYAQQDGTGFWVRGMISLSGTQGVLRGMFLLALVGVPGFALVAALGGWRITRRAFLPVAAMAETADSITSGSDLSLRVPDDGSGDELSRLGRTVNSMLERLEGAFQRERQFTSDASHELRTPTAVIISQAEYALSGGAAPEDREKALESILRQARRMSVMLGQLLLLARAESGKFQPERERIDLSELCEMVYLEMEEQAKQRGLILTAELEPGVSVRGDETLLMRLVTNLLQNAAAYNRPEGKIILRLKREEDGCTLEVEDTGIGIALENLEKIWDRFYRVDPSRSGEGTGLGLSMVKWIVQLHEGRVTVESRPGEGSCFRVRLPREG